MNLTQEVGPITALNGWSLSCLFDHQDKDYDPQRDLELLSNETLRFLVEQGSGCPLGEIAKLELLKREDRIVDWRYDGFEDGHLNSTVRLKEPLQYIRMNFTVGSLEDDIKELEAEVKAK
jgi:hypothetical protein